MNEPTLTIGEVVRQAGLCSSAICSYEDLGVLPRPERTNGHRRSSSRVFQQLAFIQLAQAAGFSLVEIQTLVAEFDATSPLGVSWRTLGERKLAELDAQIGKVQGMKQVLQEGIRCQCLHLDECFPLVSGEGKETELD